MYLKYCMYREEAAGRDDRVHQCEGLQKREDRDIVSEQYMKTTSEINWRSSTSSMGVDGDHGRGFLGAWRRLKT